VQAVDVFVDSLDLDKLGFGVQPLETGRPGYHPGIMLKFYIYGYLNRVPSSRRLERECQRNIELSKVKRTMAGRSPKKTKSSAARKAVGRHKSAKKIVKKKTTRRVKTRLMPSGAQVSERC
jgi:transposase